MLRRVTRCVKGVEAVSIHWLGVVAAHLLVQICLSYGPAAQPILRCE
jgi:hypothetical protein